MARFTKEFENPYPSGWANLPSEDTPITADALQEHTDSADRVESYLEGDLADDLDSLTDTLTYYEESGYLGRNLCDSKVNPVASATEVWLKSGTYTWSEQSTSGSGAWYISAKNSSGTVITSSAMTPPSGYNLNSSSAWYYGGADKSSGTFTVSQDCCVLIARLDANNTVGLQVEYGTIAHSYTPYSKSNVALTNDTLNLKMLGWTVPSECPIQNSASGNTFTQRVGRVDLGTLAWSLNGAITSDTYEYATTLSSKKNGETNMYCDKFTVQSERATNCIRGRSASSAISIVTTDTTVTSLLSHLSGTYLYYELATPIVKTIDGNEFSSVVDGAIDGGYISLNILDYSKTSLNRSWNNTVYNGRATLFVDVKPSTTYTLSYGSISELGTCIAYEKTDKDSQVIISQFNFSNNYTFTTSSTTRCLALLFIPSSTPTLEMVRKAELVLVEGSTSKPYIPSNTELQSEIDGLGTVQSVTPSLTSIVASGQISVQKIGRIAFVSIQNVILTQSGNYQTLATNMPICRNNGYVAIPYLDDTSDGTYLGTIYIGAGSNVLNITSSPNATSKGSYVTFSYITD